MTRLMHRVRFGLVTFLWIVFAVATMPGLLWAAPFAAYVMDARTGEVLYEKNAETRLHPASLTKMMTLYITFQAIEAGEVSLDTMVTVSNNAAAQPPSRLGLRPGQRIALRYLIRAAAIKSANDAAAAIGDHLGGSEAKFAARMNRTAKALGMTHSSFKNANGLTREGHMSTARDMSILGRHLLYDFPQYYNLFSRRTADAGIAHVANTNRRFLDAYEGADGIKTGYTVPAGFNLTASAQRGNKRIIATIFGGTSTASRNAKMAELLDLGFARAPNKARAEKPEPPMLLAEAESEIAGPQVATAVIAPEADEGEEEAIRLATASAAAATIAARASAQGAPTRSPRPRPRPALARAVPASETTLAAAEHAAETAPPLGATRLASDPVRLAAKPPALKPAQPAPIPAPVTAELVQMAAPQPETLAMLDPLSNDLEPQGDADASGPVFIQTATAQPETLALAPPPGGQNDTVILAALSPPAPMPEGKREVVARASSSGGRNWGINLGKYPSQYAAEQALLKTALMESTALSQGLRKVATRKTGYEALFVGLSRGDADLACARLAARAVDCTVIGP